MGAAVFVGVMAGAATFFADAFFADVFLAGAFFAGVFFAVAAFFGFGAVGAEADKGAAALFVTVMPWYVAEVAPVLPLTRDGVLNVMTYGTAVDTVLGAAAGTNDRKLVMMSTMTLSCASKCC